MSGKQGKRKENVKSSGEAGVGLEDNKYILGLVNSWITCADTKISISCGIFTVVFAVIAFFCENYLVQPKDTTQTTVIINTTLMSIGGIVWLCALLFFIFAFYLHIVALLPRLWSIDKKKENGCNMCHCRQYTVFYSEISEFKSGIEYAECAHNATIMQLNEEILKEIYVNSGICTKKMHKMKQALWSSFASIVLSIVGCVLLYLAK